MKQVRKRYFDNEGNICVIEIPQIKITITGFIKRAIR